MSRHATEWAWKTNPGSSSLKLILLSMADRADEYNLCYPSIERLVTDTSLNKKTVQAGLISLIGMGLISDTGERKGATRRVRVFSLNIPKNGNVTKIGNIPKNGKLNDPKNGKLNDPKNGMQNLSVNQSYNQEKERGNKTGGLVPPEPDANNTVINNFVPHGGLGQFGKFVMHENWSPSDDFLRVSSLQGINLDCQPTPQELAEFRVYWMAEGKAFHHAQWEQKLARRLQISRQNKLTSPENNVPHWNSPEAWEDFL
ncbi:MULTISPECIES: DnaT-like ssDNA-binding domain-containing protein [Citrobacter]|jgi:pyocin large subunit-like protein|uniref:DnaT-like ssDNA-binding domain-containing protein n=1 Tax=Citrobacter TaxID=544 RepID=UPI0013F12B10|nr:MULTISPECIES: DnaT-like ssDNA-binding domain-containing protein [Citrobacter]EKU6852773.1 helix-turn-helix domain-containing protein [Citrobacter freundii]EKU6861866.1 helix-turn-helix domain-containing protein [Citrobacter freundii]EKV9788527.1 helix-turn-helix domain-containing protein [Citrobacter freundii]ELG9956744.1 helix-turn-helix domain-containing protein [Citrobacter freundii]MCX2449320.1 DnaT-like ssDNA-binding domain-containing protein [Citrobacter freundii complex sp. 2022EL-00